MEFGRMRSAASGKQSAKRGSNPRECALRRRWRRSSDWVALSHCLWQQSTPRRIVAQSSAASSHAEPRISARTAEASARFFVSAAKTEPREARIAGKSRWSAGLSSSAAFSCSKGGKSCAQTRIFSAVQAFPAVEAKKRNACSDMLTPGEKPSPAGTLVERGGVAEECENRGDLEVELGIGDGAKRCGEFAHFGNVFGLVLQSALGMAEARAGFAHQLGRHVAQREIRGLEQCFEVAGAAQRLEAGAEAGQRRALREGPEILRKAEQSGEADGMGEAARVGLRLLLDQVAGDVHERFAQRRFRLRQQRTQRPKQRRLLQRRPVREDHLRLFARRQRRHAVFELGVRRSGRGDLGEHRAQLGSDGVQREQRVEQPKQDEEDRLVGDAARHRGEKRSQGHGGERQVPRGLLLHEGEGARAALLLRFEEALRRGTALRRREEAAHEALDQREAGGKRFGRVLDERNLLAHQQQQAIFHSGRQPELAVRSAHKSQLRDVGLENFDLH